MLCAMMRSMASGIVGKITRSAMAIPKDIAATIIMVFTARDTPTMRWSSSISETKLMSGTPGMMNNVQAHSG
ncbi:unknown [Prevotella sp. CAG:873]|nr:unknown [Prevotella sp. CAG:873]